MWLGWWEWWDLGESLIGVSRMITGILKLDPPLSPLSTPAEIFDACVCGSKIGLSGVSACAFLFFFLSVPSVLKFCTEF